MGNIWFKNGTQAPLQVACKSGLFYHDVKLYMRVYSDGMIRHIYKCDYDDYEKERVEYENGK